MDFGSRCNVENNPRNKFRVFEIRKFACRKHSSILVSCLSTKRYLLISKWHHLIFISRWESCHCQTPYWVLCTIWGTPKPKGLGLTPKQIQGNLVCSKNQVLICKCVLFQRITIPDFLMCDDVACMHIFGFGKHEGYSEDGSLHRIVIQST